MGTLIVNSYDIVGVNFSNPAPYSSSTPEEMFYSYGDTEIIVTFSSLVLGDGNSLYGDGHGNAAVATGIQVFQSGNPNPIITYSGKFTLPDGTPIINDLLAYIGDVTPLTVKFAHGADLAADIDAGVTSSYGDHTPILEHIPAPTSIIALDKVPPPLSVNDFNTAFNGSGYDVLSKIVGGYVISDVGDNIQYLWNFFQPGFVPPAGLLHIIISDNAVMYMGNVGVPPKSLLDLLENADGTPYQMSWGPRGLGANSIYDNLDYLGQLAAAGHIANLGASNSGLYLTPLQAVTYPALVSIVEADSPSLGGWVNIVSTPNLIATSAQLSALTSTQIAGLAGYGVTELTSSDASVEYSTTQSAAIRAANISVSAPADDYVREWLTKTGSETFSFDADDSLAQISIVGPVSLSAGATLAAPNVSETGSGTILTVAENLGYAGAFTQGAGTKVAIGGGDTLTLSGASSLSGVTNGAGALALTGGDATFEAGATLTAASWSVSGASTTATLDENLTFTGAFSAGAGATIALNGGNLTLKGAKTFAGGVVSGASGSVNLYNATSVSGLTIAGKAIVANYGTVTQSGGDVTIGDDVSSDMAEWLNTAASVWNIADDSDVMLGTDTASLIVNAGKFEKTGGAGNSSVAIAIKNTGYVLVSSGVLEIGGAVTGTGANAISGAATLQFDSTVAAGQTISFTGSGGTLFLGAPKGFAATLSGYDSGGAGGTGDAVQLLGSWTQTGFSENGANTLATLTLFNGSVHEALKFAGAYSSASFHLSQSGGVTTIS